MIRITHHIQYRVKKMHVNYWTIWEPEYPNEIRSWRFKERFEDEDD